MSKGKTGHPEIDARNAFKGADGRTFFIELPELLGIDRKRAFDKALTTAAFGVGVKGMIKNLLAMKEAFNKQEMAEVGHLITTQIKTAFVLTEYAPSLLAWASGPVATTSTSLANVTNAVFNGVPVGMIEVEFAITHDASATTVGAYFAIDGTATTNYLVGSVLYNTTQGDNPARNFIAVNTGGTSSSSRATTNNIAVIRATINVTVSGTIQLRYATEAAGNAITITAIEGYIKRKG